MAYNFTFGGSSLFQLIPEKIKNQIWIQNWNEYQSDVDNRLCMLNDDWNDILKSYIKNQLSTETQEQFFPPYSDPKWPIPTHINLMKRVNRERSLVYMNEPIRKMRKEIINEEGDVNQDIAEQTTVGEALETAFEESERYAEIVSNEFNIMMKKVNELTNAVNLVLVGCFPDENRGNGMRFDVLTPDMFVPIQHPKDPSQLIGVIYVISSTDTPSTGQVATRTEHIIYLGTGEKDDEPFVATVDNMDNNTVEKEPYPYIYNGEPFLPFAVFRNDYPETGQFVNRTLGNDLYEGTIFAGWLVSLWMRNYQDSTGKQILITGSHAGDTGLSQIRDSLAILRFPMEKQDAEIKEIDFDMDLSNRWEAVLKFIESIIANYGLSIDKFKSTPVSGISLKIQNQPLVNDINNQWSFYRSGEKDLADIIRKVNNALIPGVEAIPDDTEFMINFGRLPFDDNPIEQWDTFVLMAQKGIKSYADIYMLFDQDITSVEEAQIAIKRNKKLNRELGETGGNTLNELPIPIEPETEEEETGTEANPLLEVADEEI